MRRPQIAKLMFWSVSAAGVLGGAFLAGLYSGANENKAFAVVRDLRERTRDAVKTVMNEAPILVRARPEWHLQPARHAGSGVTINETQDDSLVLMAGFFDNGNGLRLVRRDGSTVMRWPVEFSKIFTNTAHIQDPPATDWNTDSHGALIEPDGSVVFVFEYMGLVKLDRCGVLDWKVAAPVHHSVELAESGGYWVPGRISVLEEATTRFSPFNVPYHEDTVLRISESGEILEERSLVELFYRAGMKAWLTVMHGSELRAEILHLNKVAELKTGMAADFPMFAAGDLLLSIRELNMILVTDPGLQRVKWWRVGPWIRQHDPEFKVGGLISVFNNNTFQSAFGPDNYFKKSHLTIPRVSDIIEIDPATDQFRRVYGGVEGQELLTVIRGKHELTAQGGLLVTEFEGGRVFETDSSGRVIWEYVNRYDADEVAEITEARVYPADYFKVSDWSCARPAD